MTEDNRLKNIEEKLDDHGQTLKEMADTLSKLAVQDEKLKNLSDQQQTLWRKYDALIDPNTGQVSSIVRHQASCPRDQIKFLWWFVATIDFALFIALIAVVLK